MSREARIADLVPSWHYQDSFAAYIAARIFYRRLASAIDNDLTGWMLSGSMSGSPTERDAHA